MIGTYRDDLGHFVLTRPFSCKYQKTATRAVFGIWWRRREYSAHPCASPCGPRFARSAAFPTPHVKPATRSRFPALSCKYQKTATRAVFGIWWRRRESNPRPQVLRRWLYMLIRPIYLIDGYPVGRENQQRAWMSFNGSTPGALHRDPMWVDSRDPVAWARGRAEGTATGF